MKSFYENANTKDQQMLDDHHWTLLTGVTCKL